MANTSGNTNSTREITAAQLVALVTAHRAYCAQHRIGYMERKSFEEMHNFLISKGYQYNGVVDWQDDSHCGVFLR